MKKPQKASEGKSKSIREWPEGERPRERLANAGPEKLTDAELLAIILRTGRAGKSAVELARQLVTNFKTLRALDLAPLKVLQKHLGVGFAKAVEIKAALELGKRLIREEKLPRSVSIQRSRDLVDALSPKYRDKKKEQFLVVLLDAKHRVIGERKVSEGSLTASLVHPREVMKAVVEESAAAFIAVHNHPSGDVTPSPDDRDITERLQAVAELMGIKFLDHLILGDGQKKYFSFYEQGLLR